jgi:hypothetical protein
MASAAGAASLSVEGKCTIDKLTAAKKRGICLANASINNLKGKIPDREKCETKFSEAIVKADVKAAKKGGACRWMGTGAETVIDLNKRLEWELKTDDSSIHDKDNTYSWSSAIAVEDPDGTAFTKFLGTLNGGTSTNGNYTQGCFHGDCDWRLPTIEELAGITEPAFPDCGSPPCTTIPGETVSSLYWSSSTQAADPRVAWGVWFTDGFVSLTFKSVNLSVRAVRGGS